MGEEDRRILKLVCLPLKDLADSMITIDAATYYEGGRQIVVSRDALIYNVEVLVENAVCVTTLEKLEAQLKK